MWIFLSCLIAMALKNSKTGSLPVSEIYSFMKEHFPYFKVRARPQEEALLFMWFRGRHKQTLSPLWIVLKEGRKHTAMKTMRERFLKSKWYKINETSVVTVILRQRLMAGRTRCGTTCLWISALKKWRTSWAALHGRDACGRSTLPR